MKFITENDLKDVIKNHTNKKEYKVTVPMSEAYDFDETEVAEFANELSEIFDVQLGNVNASNSINDVIEQINSEFGINEKNIRDLILDICAENPESVALIFDDKKWTYRTLEKNMKAFSANLIDIGITKNSRVAIILQNRIEYILLYFSLFYIGALPVPLNTRWGKQEIFNVLNDACPDCIVTEEKIGSHAYGAYIEEYEKKYGYGGKVIYFEENHYKNGVSYDSIIFGRNISAVMDKINPDDIAMISYTSGTTGKPKGVMLKNNDIVKISLYTTNTWKTSENEYPYSIAPLYSAQGFLSLFVDFAIGKTFKMTSTFNPNDILKEISKQENTVIHTQPTMWSLLLNCKIVNFANFDSLEKLVVSGSLCSPELAKQIESRLKTTLLNAYGLIEGTSVVTMTRMSDTYDVRMNTVGRAIPGVKIKIVDGNRKEVKKGEVGELAIKGYNMVGYYNNDKKTREIIDNDGWLYTGDLARYYDDENICIVGRCKDMIIRGGFNVYPSDIEEHILQIEGVQNTAVVGKKNDILGEEIVAFILLRPGITMTKNDVIRNLFNKLANYKIPDKVIFVSEIPTILAGKIDKKVLSEWAENGVPEDKKIIFERKL